jgi:hypothetical protein
MGDSRLTLQSDDVGVQQLRRVGSAVIGLVRAV